MEKTTVADWDMAESLDTKEDIIAHIEVALAEKDTGFFLETIRALSRLEGMTRLARELGVTREGLYKSLSPEGNPIINILNLNSIFLVGVYRRLGRADCSALSRLRTVRESFPSYGSSLM